MRVLLVARDLYRTIGGSETVYKKIIEANPGVEFVYFRVSEPAHAKRPSNTSSVPLQSSLSGLRVTQPFFPIERLDSIRDSEAFARSVAGQSFDIVEFPDYFAFGTSLRDCLRHHKVTFGAIVLAMYGNISTSLDMGWAPSGLSIANLRMLEYEQFVDADGRYAVSQRDVAQWKARADLDIHLLDPLAILAPIGCGEESVMRLVRPATSPTPVDLDPPTKKPDLYCIGRMERRKGNDLFVDILRWLNPALYGEAFHVGGDNYTRTGVSSRQILTEIARAREVKVGFLPNQDQAGLASIFARNSLVILPVRYDLLNLVGLESVLSGCPTVISNGAGVCDYLDQQFPTIPYIKLDLANIYGVLPQIEALLADYPKYRRRLVECVIAKKAKPGSLDLRRFYESTLERARRGHSVAQARRAIRFEVAPVTALQHVRSVVRWILPDRVRQLLKRLVREPRTVVRDWALRLRIFSDARLAWYAFLSLQLKRQYKKINVLSEDSKLAIAFKAQSIYSLGSGSVYRCNIWREMARLERLRGNELVAVSYDLRLMRLLGGDVLGQLPAIISSLDRNGFSQEALACKALYELPEQADQRAYEFLQSAANRFLRPVAKEWELLDDRRHGVPRVSIIVSLFNAAPKLRLFLTALAQQTLVRQDGTEIILVDSGSNTDEYRIIKEFLADHPLNIVYARSSARETIQAAWNRGIQLARAPYLVFLGVDETVYPEALEVLASELDRNPSVDWVMANSLVTDVDEQGIFKKDVMPYDRTGATKDHVYLETCYISWVGGMYRRSIHERFGYYDESFRAAGDSEFKHRVLPHINVRFIPKTLGLFLNYPDDRTTASPVAEIEDMRAWYIHRTPGGVRYAFEGRAPEEALALCYAALGYRKSYCQHTSCDIEYALHLLRYSIARGCGLELASMERDLAKLLADLKSLEWADQEFHLYSPAAILARTWRNAHMFETTHADMLRGKATPTYRVLNDNRFEQHSWIWKTFS